MDKSRREAWITGVLDDDTVLSALVLLESIRRTKTTRTVAVVASTRLTKENRIILGDAFDVILYMDGSDVEVPGVNSAEIFAFSLSMFDKCVYVSHGSLFLENADRLFEEDSKFQFLLKTNGAKTDLSIFLFEPSREAQVFIRNNMKPGGENLVCLVNVLLPWIKAQFGAKVIGSIADDIVATDKTHAPIIHFSCPTSHEQMELLSKQDLGLRENIIVANWLDVFHKSVFPVIQKNTIIDPLTNDFHHGLLCGGYRSEPIAIVGMSCRYPGANTLDEFWNLMYRGEDAIGKPPAFRWTSEHAAVVAKQTATTTGGYLATSVDEFDFRFFGLNPKDASFADPQTRLLQEVAWESLEDAGIDPMSLHGTHTGVFTGAWMKDYRDIVLDSGETDFIRTYMGSSFGAAAARLSFFMGLTGPSISTESGCSSAMAALDLAVKSLRSRETNLVLAGGVNLMLKLWGECTMDAVLAADGRCKTFDAKADGFGRAEGCGVLVLKRLSSAMRDRDHIWALIRGSAVSQEGLSKSVGTPTVHCEALAMTLALKDANIPPEYVSFVETHGTGTPVGDPLEIKAICKAYNSAARVKPLVIGSAKTNVGHTEACSGITGIMKTVLALQNEILPRHRNLDEINPEIRLETIPAVIPLENMEWPKVKGKPRFAGVSSFGITGTDGHVIIQESPDAELPKFSLGLVRPTHILKISGKSEEALEDLLKEYERLLTERAKANNDFENVAFSANIGRSTFAHRAFIVAPNYQQAVRTMKERTYQRADLKDGDGGEICFLFTGQGSQYPGMAKMLYETSPIFRVNFDVCDRILRKMYQICIRNVLWDSPDNLSGEISRTIYSQTSIFCVEYCLLKLWQSWGIQPSYVLGHSLGEYCAAVAAGVLDLKGALQLVAERSRLIEDLARGSMLVVRASQTEVNRLLKSAAITDLDIAAVSTPEQTVVAGDTEIVGQFMRHLRRDGVKSVILEATHAFHSRHMDIMLGKFRKIAETIEYKKGNIGVRYISGMDGKIVGNLSNLGADYWVRHARGTVSFQDACTAIGKTGCRTFIEIGPQPILSSFVMMNNDNIMPTCLPSLRRKTDDWDTILMSLGKLYLLGYAVNWKGFDDTYPRKKVSLPFHPFHRKPCWMDTKTGGVPVKVHPLVGHPVRNALALNIFQNDISPMSVPWLKDHRIGARYLFPGAAYTEMCLYAGHHISSGLNDTFEIPTRAVRLRNFRIASPLELMEGKSCRLQTIVDFPKSGEQQHDNQYGCRVKIFHENANPRESEKWVLHSSTTFLPVVSSEEIFLNYDSKRIAEIISENEPITPDYYYKLVDGVGLKFGDSFQTINRFWRIRPADFDEIGLDEIVTEIGRPTGNEDYLLHPLVIDAAFQCAHLTQFDREGHKLFVPVRVGQLTPFGVFQESDEGNGDSLLIHAWSKTGKFQVMVTRSSDFAPIAFMEDLEFIDTNVREIESVLAQQSNTFPSALEQIWKVVHSPLVSRCNPVEFQGIVSDSSVQDRLEDLRKVTETDAYTYEQVDRLAYLYILNAFLKLGWNPKEESIIEVESFCSQLKIKPEFHQVIRYYWTVLQEEACILQPNHNSQEWRVESIPPSLDVVKSELANLSSELNTSNVALVVGVLDNILKNLAEILTGSQSALAHLFPTDKNKEQYSANAFYQYNPAIFVRVEAQCIGFKSIIENIQEQGRSDSSEKILRVLEVGSGTGADSIRSLHWLKEVWGDRFEFYYTDISHSFFAKAEKRMEEYSKNITYAIFNIEKSPLSQGIPLGYFDIVCCMEVLHATRSLEESLVHLRQTLRPGGTLYFSETIRPIRNITSVFGLLEGYWRFQDFEWRKDHCCVDEKVWEQLLLQTGYNNVYSTKFFLRQVGNRDCSGG